LAIIYFKFQSEKKPHLELQVDFIQNSGIFLINLS